MSSPKIKMYQLEPGYTEDSDNDIQSSVNDELLPVVPKSQILTDAMPLTGIVPSYQELLQPLDLGSGRSTYPLSPNNALTQLPTGIAWENVIKAHGEIGIQVFDHDNNPLDIRTWQIANDGIRFAEGEEPPPSGATMSCYQTGDLPCETWALKGNDLYDGPNSSFNRVLVKIEDGEWITATPAGPNSTHITTPAPANQVRGTYAYKMSFARNFCGDHPNWVSDHLWLRPDVFVGTTDYPGDAAIVDGIPYEPGPVPKYVNHNEYALNARDGLVTFAQDIDSSASPVKANYSYYPMINNVTSQTMDEVFGEGGLVFKADTETAFPDSHNRKWIRQKSTQMPLTVYVDGEIVPKTQTVLPYDTLTPITG